MEWTRLANTKLRHGSSPSAATRTRRSAPSAYEPGWCGHQFPISPRDVFAVIAPHFVTLLTVVRQHNSAQSARVLATRQRATSNTSASTRHPGPLYHSLYYASCPGGPQAPASLSSTAVPAPHHPSCFPSSVQNLFSIGRRSLVSSGQLLINERRRGSHASDASHALYAGIGMPFPKFFIKFSGVSSTMIVLWRAQPRACRMPAVRWFVWWKGVWDCQGTARRGAARGGRWWEGDPRYLEIATTPDLAEGFCPSHRHRKSGLVVVEHRRSDLRNSLGVPDECEPFTVWCELLEREGGVGPVAPRTRPERHALWGTVWLVGEETNYAVHFKAKRRRSVEWSSGRAVERWCPPIPTECGERPVQELHERRPGVDGVSRWWWWWRRRQRRRRHNGARANVGGRLVPLVVVASLRLMVGG
mmetsp:Transcript_45377/g.125021  ORF Transcript_45377/g.125021 Transcript_45377/m.125021 type:complete len:416 (-) Transcript_45377:512-1759(-)